MAAANLKGWAIVTGSGRGIGKAIALSLSQLGYPMALVARSEDQLKAVAAECIAAGAPDAIAVPLNLADTKTIDPAIASLLEKRPIDVLVNNAGKTAPNGNSPDAGDPNEWEDMMDLNVNAPMRLTRLVTPGMIERETGVIINMGSVAAIEGMTNSAAYAASKHAIRGWSISCYQKLRVHGIKVALIHPGFVDTDLVPDFPGLDRTRMLKVSDIAAAAMLIVTTSEACCPCEITLRCVKPAC